MTQLHSCNKQQFDEFIAGYPEPLVHDITFICEPPMHTWNDFSNGKKWPESVVATRVAVWDFGYRPTGEYSYRILQSDSTP